MYSNYRNNMPHYDSMPYNLAKGPDRPYMPRHEDSMYITNTMPAPPFMPEDMFDLRPFIPDTEIPFTIDGDAPAAPRTPETQPGMPETPASPVIPGMPQVPMPQMPFMPQTPTTLFPGMPPNDGNAYPFMPPIMPQLTCEQLRELMRLMDCPLGNGMNNINENTNEVPR